MIESELHQGELETHHRPEEVAETGPGHLGGPVDVEEAVHLPQLDVVADTVRRRRIAPAADLLGVLLGHPVGRGGIDQVGQLHPTLLERLVQPVGLRQGGLVALGQLPGPGNGVLPLLPVEAGDVLADRLLFGPQLLGPHPGLAAFFVEGDEGGDVDVETAAPQRLHQRRGFLA